MSTELVSEGGRPARLVVISGMSGSGKTTAIRALEDVGFFCIDNLPLVLLPKVMELFPASNEQIERVALVLDAREGRFLASFAEQIEAVRRSAIRLDVLFLDCDERELVRRYQETRRGHPLFPDGPVSEGIARERQVLEPIRRMADAVLDTTSLDPHQLRQIVQQRYLQGPTGQGLALWLISFGYKYGLPIQAHLVFDARFLPNPYFAPGLREEDGRNQQVADFVLKNDETQRFLQAVESFLRDFLPAYDREGKSHLAAAIGCTGGRHRSVVLVEELARRMKDRAPLKVLHRDLERI